MIVLGGETMYYDKLNFCKQFLAFASADETRPPLCGVFVDKSRTVACNSYIMVEIRAPLRTSNGENTEAAGPSVLLSSTDVSKLLKLGPDKDVLFQYTEENELEVISKKLGTTAIRFVPVDAQPPNYDQLLDIKADFERDKLVQEREYETTVNGDYLARIGLLAKVVPNALNKIDFTFTGPLSSGKPIKFKIGSRVHGLIMPISENAKGYRNS